MLIYSVLIIIRTVLPNFVNYSNIQTFHKHKLFNKKRIMTIKKFLLQLSFIFALIIGLVACEKDLTIDPVNQLNQQITPDDDSNDDTDTIDGDWCGGHHGNWGDWFDTHGGNWGGDWQILCDSLVGSWSDHLDSLGIDYSTWCDSLDGDWGDWGGHGDCDDDSDHGDWDDWDFDCDSLVAIYGDKFEEFGIDPTTFCDSLDGDWNWDDWGGHDGGHNDDDNDHGGWDDWDFDCDSLVAIYGDKFEVFGIDPTTFCDSLDGDWDWDNWGGYDGGHNDDDNDHGGWDDWDFDCDSLVAIYGDKFEEFGIDPTTFCDSLDGDWDWDNWGGHDGGHNDDDNDHGGWDDWDFDCDSLVAIYGDKFEEFGIDPTTFCDSLDGDWDWGGHDDDSDDDSDDDDG